MQRHSRLRAEAPNVNRESQARERGVSHAAFPRPNAGVVVVLLYRYRAAAIAGCTPT